MPVTARAALSRRRLLGLIPPLLLAACGESEAPRFAPLTYDYLGKLKLNVAAITVDDAFARRELMDATHVEDLAPTPPADALKRMAQDRLIPVGNAGHAVFVIEDTSIVRAPDGFAGSLHVRLNVAKTDGTTESANARVARTYTSDAGDDPDATRAALYTFVKLLMNDMNVEFEYQVKHSLRDVLQPTETAPPPPPVQIQNLGPTAPGQLAPPPSAPGQLAPPSGAPVPLAPPPGTPSPLTPPPAATPSLP